MSGSCDPAPVGWPDEARLGAQLGGAAEDLGVTLNENTATDFEAFKRTVSGAFVDFFEDEVIPVILDVWDALKPVGDWINEHKETLGPFALGGSSMSGAVALVYALRHPEKIKKLLLSGAFGVQPRVPLHPAACLAARVPGLPAFFRHALDTPATMRLALLAALGHRHALTDELVADARAGLERPDALDAFAVWLRTELLPDRVRTHVTPSLDRLTMPVLWLHGGRDWMLPVRHTRRAARRIAASSVVLSR